MGSFGYPFKLMFFWMELISIDGDFSAFTNGDIFQIHSVSAIGYDFEECSQRVGFFIGMLHNSPVMRIVWSINILQIFQSDGVDGFQDERIFFRIDLKQSLLTQIISHSGQYFIVG